MFGVLLEIEMLKKCMLLWREANFQVKMHKKHIGNIFGTCDVQKVHAVVARSTFPSQNAQNASASEHFWKFRCRKSARRCGANRISKSKVLKLAVRGHFLSLGCGSAWQAQWILHVVCGFCSSWKTMAGVGVWRGSAKMHFPWQAQYKRHVYERC